MQLLSDMSNCIFYNALSKYGEPRRLNDIELLKNFRSANDQHTVVTYYQRAKPIVQKLNSKQVDQGLLWMNIATKFVYPILEDLRISNLDLARSKLFAMLNELEKM